MVAGSAVVVGCGDRPDEATGGARIEFDAPIAMAFAKIEVVSVDLAPLLFGEQAAVASHDDPFLGCKPCLKVGLVDFSGGFDPQALRGLPERSDVVKPPLEWAVAFLGWVGAHAVESVVV